MSFEDATREEMTNCSNCAARFAADPATEALWREMHARRFHESTRATTHGNTPSFSAGIGRRNSGGYIRPNAA